MTKLTLDQAIQLAVEKHQAGRLSEAEEIYRKVLTQVPEEPNALHFLGIIASQKGQYAPAVSLIERAIKSRPDYASAYMNLGNIHLLAGHPHPAIAAFQRVIELMPQHADAHSRLAFALVSINEFDRAIASCHRAIEIQPDNPETFNNLGMALAKSWRLDEATTAFEKALQLNPSAVGTQNNLANIQKEMGKIDLAIAGYRKVVALTPDDPVIHSNLLATLICSPSVSGSELLAEHRQWARRYADPVKHLILPHDNPRDPDRPLRIGYVSPDFTSHPVGRFMLPLIEAHDHSRFRIFAYSGVRSADDFTSRIQSHTDAWRNILPLSDEAAVETIRKDKIDILVDLAAHATDNRLRIFAYKPAPVQVTYLAYPGTTGLDTIEYRLTDPFIDPPESPRNDYSEQSIWLPQTYWCYQPQMVDLAVSPLPAMTNNFITFGCLNSFSKVSDPSLHLWSKLLESLPGSKLLLHCPPGSHRDRVHQIFSQSNVDPQRITFIERLRLIDYMVQYQQMDIALDPFPYAGGTTTCDALWMGVPVITLAGQTAITRGGVSILSNIGLPNLIAQSAAEYARIAVELAGNLEALSQMRADLRQRMKDSPLMDIQKFAREIEKIYRQIWQKWCASPT